MTSTLKKYPTKPIESWAKAKELRLDHYAEIGRAREEGRLITTGSLDAFVSVLAGMGDFVHLAAEPYGASIATNQEFADQCTAEVEARGFARDLCAYLRNFWGSVFIDRYLFGGHFPKPDLCFQIHLCDTHAKWLQMVAEHYRIPMFSMEMPVGPRGYREELKLQFLVDQIYEAIAWLEKVTGRKFDDERFYQSIRNETDSMSLWAEICTLNKAVPAPLDQKSMFSFYIIALLMRHEKKAVDFYKMLRDETRDRISRGIAALATERCRLLDDSPPPWYFLSLYRYFEKFGAVSVGSIYSFGLMGAWEDQEDGSMGPMKRLDEMGVEFTNRDQAVRFLANWHLRRTPYFLSLFVPQDKNRQLMRMVKEWKADGVLFHLNRGCEGASLGQMENRLALMKAGIPVLTYEGNMGDKREFDPAQVLDRVDSFMESLGLSKLEK